MMPTQTVHGTYSLALIAGDHLLAHVDYEKRTASISFRKFQVPVLKVVADALVHISPRQRGSRRGN